MRSRRVGSLPTALALSALALGAALTGCVAEQNTAAPTVITVPTDRATISAAVADIAEGGLVLVEPGVYPEQVLVKTADVTIRGVDRNATIVDGEGVRPYGIVAIADGVRIENLTVREATFYGVLVTGMHTDDGPTAHGGDGYTSLDPEKFPPIQRFSIDHVTAYNNGLYGLYAFDAQNGVIQNSYASGSADSGIYVGQCRECNILVTGNVAEANAVGFENANASDSVLLVGNRFSGNRVGMTLISNYQEAFTPQHSSSVVGNVISGNDSADSPAQADGGFGTGIGIAGGQDNLIARNLIEGNPRAGVTITNTEDLAADGTVLDSNSFGDNGVDVANISAARAPATGLCLTGAAVLAPSDLDGSCATAAPLAAIAASGLPPVTVPPGVSFLRVAAPPAQPNMTAITSAPARLPATPVMPELSSIGVPSASLLAELSRKP